MPTKPISASDELKTFYQSQFDALPISQSEAKHLTKVITQWANDFLCENATSELSTCVPSQEIQEQIARITADTLFVDFEAPVLYSILKSFLSHNPNLTLMDITVKDVQKTYELSPLTTQKTWFSTLGLDEIYEKFGVTTKSESTTYGDPSYMEKYIQITATANKSLKNRLLARDPNTNEVNLFGKDEAGKAKIIEKLSYYERIFTQIEQSVSTYISQERKEATSYWHYVNAENALGLSGWSYYFNDNAEPFSESEFAGARSANQTINNILTGIRSLKSFIKNDDYLPLKNLYVLGFLKTPMGESLHHYFNVDAGDDPNSRLPLDTFKAFEWAITKINSAGATQLADSLLDNLDVFLGKDNAEAIRNQLEGAAFRFVDNQLTSISNALLSLDSLFLTATGCTLAKILGQAKRTQLAVETISEVAKKWRFVAPATPVLRATGSSMLAKSAVFVFNFGAEVGKAYAYTSIADAAAGEDGAQWTMRAYLFLAGFIGTAHSVRPAQMARDLLSGKPNSHLDDFLVENNSNTGALDALADDLSRRAKAEGISVNKADGLPKTDSKAILRLLINRHKELERLAAEEAHLLSLQQKVDKAIEEVRDIVSEAKIPTEHDFMKDIQRILNETPELPKARERIEALKTPARKHVIETNKQHARELERATKLEADRLAMNDELRLLEEEIAAAEKTFNRDYLQEAKTIASESEDPSRAFRQIRGIRSDLKGNLNASAKASEQYRPDPNPKKIGRGPRRTHEMSKPDARSPASDPVVEPELRTTTGTQNPLDALRIQLKSTPPDTLESEMISKISNDKITIDPDILAQAQDYYQRSPGYRSSFWNRLDNLAHTFENRDWTKMKRPSGDVYRSKAGKMRIIAEKIGPEQYKIIFVGSRGNVPKHIYGFTK